MTKRPRISLITKGSTLAMIVRSFMMMRLERILSTSIFVSGWCGQRGRGKLLTKSWISITRSARCNRMLAVRTSLVRESSSGTRSQAKAMMISRAARRHLRRIRGAKAATFLTDTWTRRMRRSHRRLSLQRCTCEHKRMLEDIKLLNFSRPAWFVRLKKNKTLTSSRISTRANTRTGSSLLFPSSVQVRCLRPSMVQPKMAPALLMSINECIPNLFKELTKT